MWFSLRMKDEINKADYITGNSEILTMYTSGQKSIYEFYPDKIIMQNQSKQITDTLFLTVGEVHLTYIAPKLINFIQFNYTYNGNLSFFYHHKTYSVRYLFDSIRED